MHRHTAGSDRITPTQPKYRHEDRQAAKRDEGGGERRGTNVRKERQTESTKDRKSKPWGGKEDREGG